jgi:hypothetical protein
MEEGRRKKNCDVWTHHAEMTDNMLQLIHEDVATVTISQLRTTWADGLMLFKDASLTAENRLFTHSVK